MSASSAASSPSFDTYLACLSKTAAKGPKGYLLSQLLNTVLGAGAAGGLSYGMGSVYGTDPTERSITTALATAGGAAIGHGVGKNRWLAKNFSSVSNPAYRAQFPALSKIDPSQINHNIFEQYIHGAGKVVGADVAANLAVPGFKTWMATQRSQQNMANATADSLRSPAATPASATPAEPKNFLQGIKDWAVKEPGQATAVGAGLLMALPATAALYQLSRAAGVVGDGRSIRMSASLRKRRGQATDLNFGLAPYKAPPTEKMNPMAKRLPDEGFSDDAQYLDEEA